MGRGCLSLLLRGGSAVAWRVVRSFSFCGVLLCLLLLSLLVLSLLFLLSSGLGLALLLASAGVRLLVPSLSGSWGLRRRCRVAWVVLRLKRCLRWSPLSVRPVRRVRLSPSASVLAGLLRGGSAPWLLRPRVRWRREPSVFPLAPSLAVVWRLGVGCPRGCGFPPSRGLVGCRCW